MRALVEHDPVESVWSDVGEAEIVEPEFIIKNVLPVGITFFTGPPKSYKSAIELALLLKVCGVDNGVLPPDLMEPGRDPGRVLMLSMEAPPGVLRHTAEVGMGVKIPDDRRLLAMSDPWKWRLDNPRDVKELLGWAEYLEADALAVDPLRNCHSQDENDSGAMVQMLQPFQQWATKQKKAVLFVHHTTKIGADKNGEKRMASAGDMRGTGAIFGLADATLTVTCKDSKSLTVFIDAVLKRGEAWQRTVQLGMWGHSGTESIDSTVKMIFELIAGGMKDPTILAAMKLSKEELAQGKLKLLRLGALDSSWVPTKDASTRVNNAVRKFASSG